MNYNFLNYSANADHIYPRKAIPMKYFVLIPDGMADRPIPALNGKTPMAYANKPMMDALCKKGLCGTSLNVPLTMVPESDTTNLVILSYNPLVYSKGRSPLEAMSMGLTMADDDTAIRCNVVTLSEDEENYEDRIMLDHSADEITTAEADELIKALNEGLSDSEKRLYTGVSYRHCLLWKNADSKYPFDRPHDIIGQRIGDYLPKEDNGGKIFLDFQKKGYEILKDHPVNLARKARGLRPANSPWLWSPGTKPALPSFSDKWGKKGAVISAVDLIKGIGICAGMEVIDVEGATGNCHTNYEGKAQAAINCFENGCDFVYVHVEGPDECGHRGEIENKVMSIEKIDALILKPLYEYLEGCGEDYRIMVLPDHPTPIEIRTHSSEAVPFFIYDSKSEKSGPDTFNEDTAIEADFNVADGSTLLDIMFNS